MIDDSNMIRNTEEREGKNLKKIDELNTLLQYLKLFDITMLGRRLRLYKESST